MNKLIRHFVFPPMRSLLVCATVALLSAMSFTEVKAQHAVSWYNILGGYADEGNAMLVKTAPDGWNTHKATSANVIEAGSGYFSFSLETGTPFFAALIEESTACEDLSCADYGAFYDGDEGGKLYIVINGVVADSVDSAITDNSGVLIQLNECTASVVTDEVTRHSVAVSCANDYRLFTQLDHQYSSLQELWSSHPASDPAHPIKWYIRHNALTSMRESRIAVKDLDTSSAVTSSYYRTPEVTNFRYAIEYEDQEFIFGILSDEEVPEGDMRYSASVELKEDDGSMELHIYDNNVPQDTLYDIDSADIVEFEVTETAVRYYYNGVLAYTKETEYYDYKLFFYTPGGNDERDFSGFTSSRPYDYPVYYDDLTESAHYRGHDNILCSSHSEPEGFPDFIGGLSANQLPAYTEGDITYTYRSGDTGSAFGYHAGSLTTDLSEVDMVIYISETDYAEIYAEGEPMSGFGLEEGDVVELKREGGSFVLYLNGMESDGFDADETKSYRVLSLIDNASGCLSDLRASFPGEYHAEVTGLEPYDHSLKGAVCFDGMQFNTTDGYLVFEIENDILIDALKYDSLETAYQVFIDSISEADSVNPYSIYSHGEFLSRFSGEMINPLPGNNTIRCYDTSHTLIDSFSYFMPVTTLIDTAWGVTIDENGITKTASAGWDSGHVTLANSMYPEMDGSYIFNIPTEGEYVFGLREQTEDIEEGISGILFGVYADNGTLKVIENSTLQTGEVDFNAKDEFIIERRDSTLKILRNGGELSQTSEGGSKWLRMDIRSFGVVSGHNPVNSAPRTSLPHWPIFIFKNEIQTCGEITEHNLNLIEHPDYDNQYYYPSYLAPTFTLKDVFTGATVVPPTQVPSYQNIPKGFYKLRITYSVYGHGSSRTMERLIVLGNRANWEKELIDAEPFEEWNNSIRSNKEENHPDNNFTHHYSEATTSNKLHGEKDGWIYFRHQEHGTFGIKEQHGLSLSDANEFAPHQTHGSINYALPVINKLFFKSITGNEYAGISYIPFTHTSSGSVGPHQFVSAYSHPNYRMRVFSSEDDNISPANPSDMIVNSGDIVVLKREGEYMQLYINGNPIHINSDFGQSGKPKVGNEYPANAGFFQERLSPQFLTYTKHGFKDVITSFACVPEGYYKLFFELDGQYYHTKLNKLRFFTERRYNEGELNYEVYTDIDAQTTPVQLDITVEEYGDNRYELNAENIPEGFYILKITNEKEEDKYLRFYNKY